MIVNDLNAAAVRQISGNARDDAGDAAGDGNAGDGDARDDARDDAGNDADAWTSGPYKRL